MFLFLYVVLLFFFTLFLHFIIIIISDSQHNIYIQLSSYVQVYHNLYNVSGKFVLLPFRQSIQGCTSVLFTYIDCSNSVVDEQRLQQLQSSGHCHLTSFLRLPSPSDTGNRIKMC